MSNLSEAERQKWIAAAKAASANEHDETHESWDNIKEMAKWLGIPAGMGAAGGLFYSMKRIARVMSRH